MKAAFSGVRTEHWVEAWSGSRVPRLRVMTPRSCTISASTPASASSRTSDPARSSSSSKRIVLSVTKIRAPKRWAYRQSSAMSPTGLPAACRAPKSGPAIYTASAPQSMAAMPISLFLAGASSSRACITS